MKVEFRAASIGSMKCQCDECKIRAAGGAGSMIIDVDGRPRKIQLRAHETGGVCCSTPTACCDKCKAHFAAQGLKNVCSKELEDTLTKSYRPVDPYLAGLTAMRAAEATALSTFEDGLKRSRLADLKAEYERHDAAIAARPRAPRLTAAELAKYASPDPYAEGIRKLREGR
jgi:hypothetical protein